MISDYYKNRGSYRGPYGEYEDKILNFLSEGKTLLDVGCGRTFPMAQKWLESDAKVFGLDPVIEPDLCLPEVNAVKGFADKVDCPDQFFDLIVSCAVLEHLENPEIVFKEFYRLLKPRGRAILLTPSKYDYVSLIAALIPNRFHGGIVEATEGRDEEDTFPTYYLANSRKQLNALASGAGFFLEDFKYLDQSPYSLKFNLALYKIGCLYHKIVRSIPPLNFLNGWILCEIGK